jgi:hypothetical protein
MQLGLIPQRLLFECVDIVDRAVDQHKERDENPGEKHNLSQSVSDVLDRCHFTPITVKALKGLQHGWDIQGEQQ